MKVFVYYGLGCKVFEEWFKLELQLFIDVIICVMCMMICGIDLYIFKGDVLMCEFG